MKEYRVKVSVRNNLLLSAIEAAGYAEYGGLARFCRENDMEPNDLSGLISMRHRPINQHGEFIPAAKTIMEALGACPSDLWADEQLMMKLKRNTGETTMDFGAVQAMLEQHTEAMSLPSPEDVYEANEETRLVKQVLLGKHIPTDARSAYKLSTKEIAVLSMHHGISGNDPKTLAEIGAEFGVTQERVRQIEGRALRKLRHPSNADVLKKAMVVPE